MSFLRTITTKAPRHPASLAARFSTTPLAKKDATSSVKDTIESVNKSVGESAARGIEKGQEATASLKSSVGLNKSKAEGEAHEMMGEGKGKAKEMAGEAMGKAEEVKGKAMGKAEEVKGKM